MRTNRRGFTLIELMIVMAVILILSVIGVGSARQHILIAHESATIQEIRTIHIAETAYYGSFGKYAPSLAALGLSPSSAIGPQTAGMIPETLSCGKKNGYLFAAAPTPTGYAVTAVPEIFGSTGRRSFFSDHTLVMRNSWTAEAATSASPPIE